MNILIIGATSGIGRELCLKYAVEGNKVFATGRRAELLESLEKENDKIVGKRFDMAKQEETTEALTAIWQEAGKIDFAFICAGIGDLNPTLDHALNDKTIQTNVVGWTNAVDFIFNKFEAQNCGHLVTISSLNAYRGEPLAPAYSATKSFQSNYTEALCKKAFKGGGKVSVTEIRPGLVDTQMAKGEGLFWVQPTDKIARQIMSAVRSKSRVRTVSKRWRIIGFIMRNLPWCLYKRM